MDSSNLTNKKRKLDDEKETPKDIDSILSEILLDIQEEKDTYLDIPSIIQGFKDLVEEHTEGMINRCMVCRTDMGRCNPRQLCGKTYCYSE
tara:strand:- start:202 stop:474 length:273 start_codon:yes stop_codon:yes gene_type:complete